MLESLQQFTRDAGRELARTWEQLAEGWRELLARSSNALTRYTRGKDPERAPEEHEPEWPRWSLVAGDVSDDGKHVVVRVELPGVDRDDVDIVIEGSTLFIRGEKRHDVEHVGNAYYLRQCAYGAFERAISLPHSVDASRAEAHYRNGVLTVKVPKAPAQEPHRIAIR